MPELSHFYLSNDAGQKELATYTTYGITSEEISFSGTTIIPKFLHLRSTRPFCVNVDDRLSYSSYQYAVLKLKSLDGPNKSDEYLVWKRKPKAKNSNIPG